MFQPIRSDHVIVSTYSMNVPWSRDESRLSIHIMWSIPQSRDVQSRKLKTIKYSVRDTVQQPASFLGCIQASQTTNNRLTSLDLNAHSAYGLPLHATQNLNATQIQPFGTTSITILGQKTIPRPMQRSAFWRHMVHISFESFASIVSGFSQCKIYHTMSFNSHRRLINPSCLNLCAGSSTASCTPTCQHQLPIWLLTTSLSSPRTWGYTYITQLVWFISHQVTSQVWGECIKRGFDQRLLGMVVTLSVTVCSLGMQIHQTPQASRAFWLPACFFFFSFKYINTCYPCALVHWFLCW